MSDFNPLVSIVIPVYNGANYMCEAIDSALAQTYENIEVIVVNDGSTDSTEEIALSYGDKIRYFAKENGGVSTALNMAIANMQGEYFSWLSHDDIYLPNKIESQLGMLAGCDDCTTVVFSGFAYIDDRSRKVPRLLPTDKYTDEELSRPLFPVIYGMGGCCFLIHKSHFERVGMFDETLRMTQDYDLWFRILRGRSALCYPGALVMLRVHENQTGRKNSEKFSNEGDKLWINIMESLTEDEMIAINGSTEQFYKKIYQHLFRYAAHPDALGYAKSQLHEMGVATRNLGYTAMLTELWLSLRKVGVYNTLRRVWHTRKKG